MTEQSPSPTTERDPLALAMLAAWVGVEPDQLPATMRAHTCADTMARWKEVGEAAVAHINAQLLTDLERMKEALEDVRAWAGAYPVKHFPEPDHDAVNAAFRDAGMIGQIDRLHASWGREILSGVRQIVSAALNPQPSEKPTHG